MYMTPDIAEEGGLIDYGVHIVELWGIFRPGNSQRCCAERK
jgi:hypothetical protein